MSTIGNKEKGTVIKKVTITETYNILHKEMKIFYPGSNAISMFHGLDIDYEYWLETVLKNGKNIATRDADTGGISKIIPIGWGPKQKSSYDKKMFYKGIKMPYPNFSLPEITFQYQK